MSIRAKLAAAAASVGVMGIGWSMASANGQALLPTTTPTPDTSTTDATTPAPTTGSSGSAGSPRSSSPTGSPGTSRSASPSSAPTTGSGGTTASAWADGTYTGSTATHRFGSVTVSVTITGGTISSLSEDIVSDGDRKSDAINRRSVPTVRSAVLAANSAEVSTVSGATYTTEAYLTSLQSALDQAAS